MIKKLILLGFGLTLLIGLPLALFVLQQQTQPTTGAAPVTKFSFSGPTQVTANQHFTQDIMVDPAGQNQISFVKFAFTYDSNFLDKDGTQPLTVPSTYTILDQPTITCADNICTVTATLSIGSNQSAVIKAKTSVATMHFVSKGNTDSNGTQLAFVAGQNQALSVATADQPAENVFQTGVPATIVIGDQTTGGGGLGTTTGTDTTGTGDTTGTTGGTGGTTGGAGGTTGTNGVSVSCTSFTADKTSGTPPLQVTFTTVGTSSTDSITQLTLTYGDGTTDTVATGSGIGTGDVNNQITHSYSANGTFTAQAVLTTAGGATSTPASCQTTITVGTPSATPIAENGKLPPTGPGETFILVGAAGALLSILGLIVIAGL